MSGQTPKRLGRSKSDPLYGKGQHTIVFGEDENIDEAEMRERILAVFRDPAYRPPTLPSVSLEILELSRRPDVSFPDVVALLEQDSMLAARVLRMAQSPVYAGAARIESLKDALVRLGLRTLRDLVLEVATNLRVFRCQAYTDSMERLSRHSTVTAHLARTVSRYTAMAEEYAFLCGLLHDVGIAGILIALGDAPRAKRKPPELTMLWPVIDATHEEAAASMAKLWNLPAEIPYILGAHHRVCIEGYDHPLAATICVADFLAQELGFGLGPSEKEADTRSEAELAAQAAAGRADRSTPQTLERARQALRLDESKMKLLHADAERLVNERFGGDAGDREPPDGDA